MPDQNDQQKQTLSRDQRRQQLHSLGDYIDKVGQHIRRGLPIDRDALEERLVRQLNAADPEGGWQVSWTRPQPEPTPEPAPEVPSTPDGEEG